jgi:two-component system cell cycle response regulator DivK
VSVAGELILIVEDNEKNMKLARDVLEFAGFRVIAAGDAQTRVEPASMRRTSS